MKLSIVIPLYDDLDEAVRMIRSVKESFADKIEMEYLLVDVRGNWATEVRQKNLTSELRYLSAPNLPAAKNVSATAATGEFLFFLLPGIFPAEGAIERMMTHLDSDPALIGVAGRWCNAAGKVEIGYNVRRFPTFTALMLDILLLNKLIPRNRFTRSYKMHDFDHNSTIHAEHVNDCVFMLRRQAVLQHGSFNERYEPGWFDQLEFCHTVNRAGGRILFEPQAKFISNERVPLITRLVGDRYSGYRRAECRYIRTHFGEFACVVACAATAVGMLQRLGFSLVFPDAVRKWFLTRLRSYVSDNYIRGLRKEYWSVLKWSLRGQP
jgi:GT2 family glycosyltransferase